MYCGGGVAIPENGRHSQSHINCRSFISQGVKDGVMIDKMASILEKKNSLTVEDHIAAVAAKRQKLEESMRWPPEDDPSISAGTSSSGDQAGGGDAGRPPSSSAGGSCEALISILKRQESLMKRIDDARRGLEALRKPERKGETNSI